MVEKKGEKFISNKSPQILKIIIFLNLINFVKKKLNKFITKNEDKMFLRG